jgi:hypothetical protein
MQDNKPASTNGLLITTVLMYVQFNRIQVDTGTDKSNGDTTSTNKN